MTRIARIRIEYSGGLGGLLPVSSFPIRGIRAIRGCLCFLELGTVAPDSVGMTFAR
jgi:hypothetical protein